MLLHTLAATTDYLAQVGPNGVDAPPGAEKYQLLMNIGLWVATGVLALVGVFAGVKFAMGHADGTNTRGQQMGIAAVGIGAVFAGTATTLVNTLMT